MTVRRRGSSGSMRLMTTLVTAGLIAAGSTGIWLFNDKSAPVAAGEVPRTPVRRGDLRITLKQTGTFEAEESLKVNVEVRGQAKIVWLVDEGTIVKAGEKLVELDTTDIVKEIEQFAAQEEKAKANLVAAEADEVITKLECKSKVRETNIAVEMAELEIKKFTEGIAPKEVRDATIKIKQAQVKLDRAKAVDTQMPGLFEQGFVTKEEVAQSKLDVQTAENELGTAKLESEILEKYTHPMQMKKLGGDRDQAVAELERFKQVEKRRTAQTEAARNQGQQELDRARAQLAEARDLLKKMVIFAAGDGIVVYGSGFERWWRPEEVKVGGIAYRNQIIMRLPNLETMQVVANIHEADINRIRVDKDHPQPVTITTDTLPGRVFTGFVKKVDTLAQSEPSRQHVKRFATTIGLDKQIPRIRPGMTATVEVLVGELENVLYVPVQCVQTRRGQSYVQVGGETKPRPVEVGAGNNNFVEIKEGVTDGEEVLLAPPKIEAGESSPEAKDPKPAAVPPYGRGKGTR